jgi:Xaa-Pro aminopeptidase
VHDAGAYKVNEAGRPLEPGMVFTVEPGIYIASHKATVSLSNAAYDPKEAMVLAYEVGAAEAKSEFDRRAEEAGSVDFNVPPEFLGIGVRIEDDMLMTESGHENLSAGAPVDPDEIESVCAEESDLPRFG